MPEVTQQDLSVLIPVYYHVTYLEKVLASAETEVFIQDVSAELDHSSGLIGTWGLLPSRPPGA